MTSVPQSVICYRGTPLKHIENFDATPQGGNVDVHRTLTPDQIPVAFIDGQRPNYQLSWSFKDQKGGNEVDWHTIWMNRVEFDMSRQNDVYTNSWDPVRISEIGESTDKETGVTTYNVTAVALRPPNRY